MTSDVILAADASQYTTVVFFLLSNVRSIHVVPFGI